MSRGKQLSHHRALLEERYLDIFERKKSHDMEVLPLDVPPRSRWLCIPKRSIGDTSLEPGSPHPRRGGQGPSFPIINHDCCLSLILSDPLQRVKTVWLCKSKLKLQNFERQMCPRNQTDRLIWTNSQNEESKRKDSKPPTSNSGECLEFVGEYPRPEALIE